MTRAAILTGRDGLTAGAVAGLVLLLGAAPAMAPAAEPAASPAASPASSAVPQPGPPPVEALVKPLGLSTDQQAKLRPVIAAAQARVKSDLDDARRDGRRLDDPEVTALLRTRDADLRERLTTILTPVQMQAYDNVVGGRGSRRTETVPVHGHHEMDTPQTAR